MNENQKEFKAQSPDKELKEIKEIVDKINKLTELIKEIDSMPLVRRINERPF